MKIQNYTTDQPALNDILLGSNVSDNNSTANFRVSDLLALGNASSFKFDDMVGGTLTGIGSLVKLSSVLIPANTLTENCTIDLMSRFLKVDANSTSSTVRVYINTVDGLAGGTNIGFALGSSSSTRSASFSRTFYIKNSVFKGQNFGSESLLDQSNIPFGDGSYNIDITVDNYIMIAATNAASTSTLTIPYLRCIIYR